VPLLACPAVPNPADHSEDAPYFSAMSCFRVFVTEEGMVVHAQASWLLLTLRWLIFNLSHNEHLI
jgi:hypothetical protein